MIDLMACYIAKKMSSMKIINYEDIEIYEYGLRLIVSFAISIMGVLLISLYTKHLITALIYLYVFTYLRTMIGGFHCKSYTTCNLMYICIYMLNEVLQSYDISKVIVHLIFMLSFIVIWISGPVDHKSRVLNKSDLYIYKKKLYRRLIVLASIYILIAFIESQIDYIIAYCIMINAMLLFAGRSVRIYESKEISVE